MQRRLNAVFLGHLAHGIPERCDVLELFLRNRSFPPVPTYRRLHKSGTARLFEGLRKKLPHFNYSRVAWRVAR